MPVYFGIIQIIVIVVTIVIVVIMVIIVIVVILVILVVIVVIVVIEMKAVLFQGHAPGVESKCHSKATLQKWKPLIGK